MNGGTFDNIDIANCTDPASSTYSGLSAYTITGCFSPQSITTCVKANQGVTSVVISYVVTFVNGETCKREDKVSCAPPIGGDCCPVTTVTPCCISPNEVKYNFVASPLYSPIIGMIVTASPSANLTTSNVYDNGSRYLLGSMSFRCYHRFATVATNSVEFAITAPLSNPVSNITVRYLLANGDTCETELFTIGGYSSKLAPVVLISEGVKKDLFASTLKLDVSKVSDKTAKIKSVNIVAENDNNVSSLFFSIMGAEQFTDKDLALMPFERTLQGTKSASFILKKPLKLVKYNGSEINIVTYRKVPKFKVVMFDENNSIISEFSFTPNFTLVQTSLGDVESNVHSIALSPNPTSSSSRLTFSMKVNQEVKIDLLDLTGRLVKTLGNEYQSEGNRRSLEISAESLESGVYLVRMIFDNGVVHTEKLVITH